MRALLVTVLLLLASTAWAQPNAAAEANPVPQRDVFDLLDKAAVSYQLVLTKTDKIKEAGVPRLVAETAEKIRKRPAAYPEILATSSEKSRGLDMLREAIETTIAR